jgi:hypothetical protein
MIRNRTEKRSKAQEKTLVCSILAEEKARENKAK